MDMTGIAGAAAFLVGAPAAGGLLAGVDRIVTARMQGRKGPPLLQPFYDVGKLLQKSRLVVNPHQGFYIWGFLVFLLVAGALFFSGGDLLLSIFALAVAGVFLALGAFSVNTPYSHIGAERELLQMMAYEPMLIIAVLGLYQSTGSFLVRDIVASGRPILAELPGVFLGFLFILTIKLRKSPFDLSSSHHGHQEIVKGITTDFAGPDLAPRLHLPVFCAAAPRARHRPRRRHIPARGVRRQHPRPPPLAAHRETLLVDRRRAGPRQPRHTRPLAMNPHRN
jgi:formate hydrogenlyase subunit 4